MTYLPHYYIHGCNINTYYLSVTYKTDPLSRRDLIQNELYALSLLFYYQKSVYLPRIIASLGPIVYRRARSRMYKHVPLYKQHMNGVLMLAGFFLIFKTC